TKAMVEHDWTNRDVFVYQNRKYSYWALAVLDSGKLPQWDPRQRHYDYWIDIHHMVYTFGCIEIANELPDRFDSFVRKLSREYGAEQTKHFTGSKPSYLQTTETPGSTGFQVTERFLGSMRVLSAPQR